MICKPASALSVSQIILNLQQIRDFLFFIIDLESQRLALPHAAKGRSAETVQMDYSLQILV